MGAMCFFFFFLPFLSYCVKPQCAEHLAFVPLRNKAAALGCHEHTSPAHPGGMSSSVLPADGDCLGPACSTGEPPSARGRSHSWMCPLYLWLLFRPDADIRKDAMLLVRGEWRYLTAICLVKACFVETRDMAVSWSSH